MLKNFISLENDTVWSYLSTVSRFQNQQELVDLVVKLLHNYQVALSQFHSLYSNKACEAIIIAKLHSNMQCTGSRNRLNHSRSVKTTLFNKLFNNRAPKPLNGIILIETLSAFYWLRPQDLGSTEALGYVFVIHIQTPVIWPTYNWKLRFYVQRFVFVKYDRDFNRFE